MDTTGDVWRTPAEEWRLRASDDLAAGKSKKAGDLDSFGAEEVAGVAESYGSPGSWSHRRTWGMAGWVIGRARGAFSALALLQVLTVVGALLALAGTRDLAPLLLAVAASAWIHATAMWFTARTVETGEAPTMVEALRVAAWRMPSATGTLLVLLLGAHLVEALAGGLEASLSPSLAGLGGALLGLGLLRLGAFALPAAVVEGSGPLAALSTSLQTGRRPLSLVAELLLLQLVTWMTLVGVLMLSGVGLGLGRHLPPLFLVIVPLTLLGVGGAGLWGSAVWTLVFLRERERSGA